MTSCCLYLLVRRYSSRLVFFVLACAVPFTSAAQTTKAPQTSLEGRTEAYISNGQAALRILHPAWGFTPVERNQIDKEDELVFSVMRFSNFWTGFQEPGTLAITSTRIIYKAGLNSAASFDLSRDEVKEVRTDKFRGLRPVTIVFKKNKQRFTLRFSKSDFAYDKEAYPALDFLSEVLNDYKAGLKEFDGLTASVGAEITRQTEAKRLALLDAAEKERLSKIEAEERAKQAQLTLQERFDVVKAEQAKRKEYESRLEKALNESQPTVKLPNATKTKIEIALKALRKMNASTEIGVTVAEYSSRLIDTKVEVDEAIALLPQGFLKDELQLSLQAFIDVGRAWQETGKYDFMLLNNEMAWLLMGRYGLEPVKSPAGSELLIWKRDVESTVWNIASIHLKNAALLAAK